MPLMHIMHISIIDIKFVPPHTTKLKNKMHIQFISDLFKASEMQAITNVVEIFLKRIRFVAQSMLSSLQNCKHSSVKVLNEKRQYFFFLIIQAKIMGEKSFPKLINSAC